MAKPSKETTLVSHQQRIMSVLLYIQGHLDEPLSLDALAKKAFFSPHHFHRTFKAFVGEPVKAYVRRLKVQRALIQMATSDKSLTEIALMAGFESLEAFSRVVKKMYGEAPSRLRERAKQGLADVALSHREGPVPPCRVESLPDLAIAFIRHVGPYAQAMAAWIQLIEHVSLDAVQGENAWCIGIAYDVPEVTPEDKCRYDAGVLWRPEYAEQAGLSRQVLAGGNYLVVTHRGTLESINKTYEAFFAHVVASGRYQFKDQPSFMRYLEVDFVGDVKNQVTDIYFPII